jgi:hypothetical protein
MGMGDGVCAHSIYFYRKIRQRDIWVEKKQTQSVLVVTDKHPLQLTASPSVQRRLVSKPPSSPTQPRAKNGVVARSSADISLESLGLVETSPSTTFSKKAATPSPSLSRSAAISKVKSESNFVDPLNASQPSETISCSPKALHINQESEVATRSDLRRPSENMQSHSLIVPSTLAMTVTDSLALAMNENELSSIKALPWTEWSASIRANAQGLGNISAQTVGYGVSKSKLFTSRLTLEIEHWPNGRFQERQDLFNGRIERKTSQLFG